MSFTIRTSCPYDNKYYIMQSSGGWNGAVKGNPTKSGANVLANCFTGDTKIITREGLVALEDIVDKEIMALSLDGKYRKAIGRYFGEQEIYELHLTNGAVYKTTPNHRWLVKSFAKNEVLKEKTTEQLIVGDYIPYNKLEPLKINEDGIRHGFIYGDGGYYNDKKQSKANLCGYKKEYMKKYFENSAHNCESNGVESYYPYPKEYKKVADINETLDYLNGFLIGLIASDGCVDNKDGCVTISTTKKNDADEIKNICIVLGHRAKITKELRDTNYRENSLLYRVHIKKSTLSSEMFLNPQHKQNFGQPKEINYTRVTEIKKTGLYDSVFCIQEPETHTMTLENGELTGQCVRLCKW